MNLEKLILTNLTLREEYGRKVLPFLKVDYFHEKSDQLLFVIINEYIQKYNSFPSIEALVVDLTNKNGIDQKIFEEVKNKIGEFNFDNNTEIDWLVDNTEKWCQEKAIYNAIFKSIQILDNKDVISKGAIPQLLTEALGVSFDSHIGHNWIDDSESRYKFYHQIEERVAFNLDYFNRITKGGLPRKTLNVILAGTGVGKSLAMCNFAADNLLNGKNVLYITLEMAEERIAERIDANLLNIKLDNLIELSYEDYQKKIDKVSKKTNGKLIIKEYPTSSAGSANFRHILNELRIKKNFKPDIIYIDYLNICASSRIKTGSNVNSYTYIKAIAEELRGLAVEFAVPIVTATQTTRTGFTSSDLGLEDTSESFGLPATADFMFALITSEELESLNQLMVKQLKNRYADPSKHKRFVIGIDRSKMKLYDVDQSAHEDLIDDTPLMDKTSFGKRDDDKNKKRSKFDLNKFDDFK
jgi:hypothetical protein